MGTRKAAMVAAAGVVIVGVSVLVYNLVFSAPEGPERVIDELLVAWESEDWDGIDDLVADTSAGAGERHADAWEALDVVSAQLDAAEPVVDGETATADYDATVELGGFGEWSWSGSIDLRLEDETWLVEWSPATIHPALTDDRVLARTAEWGERAPILSHDGQALAAPQEVIEIGVVPARIEDRPAVLALLAETLQADPEQVVADLDAPAVQPDWFVPVEVVRPERFAELDPVLRPVPGIVFRQTTARLAPADGMAPQVIGRTGPITAELLEEWGPPYGPHDVVGLSGLEREHEHRLAGTPSGEVQVRDDEGEVVEVLHRFEGTEPQPVRTSLDVGVQSAADAALADVVEPSALVAVDVATGELRGVVSRPLEDFGRALSGRYPPGSTFKVVTAAAALDQGVAPTDPVDCPVEAVVGGRSFRNAGGLALGTVDFRTLFARSCNTGFVTLGTGLDDGRLADWAARFGFATDDAADGGETGGGTGGETDEAAGGEETEDADGAEADPATGTYPEPADEAEAAAAAIGQGRVTASPAHMASVAAAVAAGEWRPPTLVVDPAPAEEAAAPQPLDPAIAATLTELMVAVVAEGTGTAAAVEGPPVAGKTGTAEFGTEVPPATHAWFIGFRESLAFAVLVEGGGGGGDTAAPLAGAFLRNLG